MADRTEATVARVWELAEPLAALEGMEIVDIELRGEGTRRAKVLRLYLDKPGGADVESLTRVSRELGEILDARDPIEGAYTLEVSSPGINRPLKKPEHFSRFVGKRVRVRTREMIEGRRSFLGILQAVSEHQIALEQDGKRYEIPFSAIERSNYEHDWSA
ncbi:MAG TPA: ribosome maturation factor RimP [Candidatus Eisenbacteria bacterium]|nr:ribosome maturation factor RimP [Candidatus Eisenbacteria bacterium]